jgi:hypothetical protein
VELYAAALLALGAIGLALWKQRGRPRSGVVAGLGIVAASGVRLVTEPMRISLDGGPTWFYAAGVVGGSVLAVVAAVRASESGASGS